jgi:hypothetical protein
MIKDLAENGNSIDRIYIIQWWWFFGKMYIL